MASARHLAFPKWPVSKSQKHTLDHTQIGPYLPLLKCQPLLSMRKICLPLLTKLPVAPRNAYARRCRFAVRLRSGSQLHFVARTPSPSPYATHTPCTRSPSEPPKNAGVKGWKGYGRAFRGGSLSGWLSRKAPGISRLACACELRVARYFAATCAHATAMARAGCLLTN